MHFNPLHEAASHFAELNGLKVYYEIHGEGRPRYYYTAAGTANVPRLWQPTGPSRPCRTVGIIEAVIYPFRGDTGAAQWNWLRAPT